MCYDLNDVFLFLGFEIFSEDEITSELYAFDNLNFPPEHPARESMDTYWLFGHNEEKGGKRLVEKLFLNILYYSDRKSVV